MNCAIYLTKIRTGLNCLQPKEEEKKAPSMRKERKFHVGRKVFLKIELEGEREESK